MSEHRLIAFGCSYTFGHGLPDCIGSDIMAPGLMPSQYAYPSLIATVTNRRIINLSRPGSSNKEIAYRIQNFKFNKSDMVLLSWTHSERSMIALENSESHILGPWCPDKKSKLYYKHFYNVEEERFTTELYYSWANLFLLNKVYKVINTPPFMVHSNNFIDIKKYNFLLSEKTILDFKVDEAGDGKHPGIRSNQNFASYIIENFT